MSTYAFIEVNSHPCIESEEGYLPELITLFSEDELDSDARRYRYVSTVRVMLDRLQLQGFTAGRAVQDLETAVRRWHEKQENPLMEDLGVATRDTVVIQGEMKSYINTATLAPVYRDAEEPLGELDARCRLRLFLDASNSSDHRVIYNLDGLLEAGSIPFGGRLAAEVRSKRKGAVASVRLK